MFSSVVKHSVNMPRVSCDSEFMYTIMLHCYSFSSSSALPGRRTACWEILHWFNVERRIQDSSVSLWFRSQFNQFHAIIFFSVDPWIHKQTTEILTQLITPLYNLNWIIILLYKYMHWYTVPLLEPTSRQEACPSFTHSQGCYTPSWCCVRLYKIHMVLIQSYFLNASHVCWTLHDDNTTTSCWWG